MPARLGPSHAFLGRHLCRNKGHNGALYWTWSLGWGVGTDNRRADQQMHPCPARDPAPAAESANDKPLTKKQNNTIHLSLMKPVRHGSSRAYRCSP